MRFSSTSPFQPCERHPQLARDREHRDRRLARVDPHEQHLVGVRQDRPAGVVLGGGRSSLPTSSSVSGSPLPVVPARCRATPTGLCCRSAETTLARARHEPGGSSPRPRARRCRAPRAARARPSTGRGAAARAAPTLAEPHRAGAVACRGRDRAHRSERRSCGLAPLLAAIPVFMHSTRRRTLAPTPRERVADGISLRFRQGG